ncbi:3' terminal RNA ribose 2'-O-methyltransferase Hen1 [Auraticoccus monumenti]|uniref:Small RNA 2'-O-methyltransferase n=1 Tax=Auraticoccus monumenti TaxID=675864 RepID=A0A1G6YK84_9ACTN|nr:3' terminal RNA ribose 2'-O-methyltransferase Hen1 [Auraticoccus monumenti]
MYLTITSTASPATDLGYLLHKHPERVGVFPVGWGTAHVFYPEATTDRCTAAVLLEVDPVALVQARTFRADGFALGQYVNDRPYTAGSLLAVALKQVFGTAMRGRCTARPELEGVALPLELTVPSLRSRGGAELVHRLFEPLGWEVTTRTEPLDPEIPGWGDSRTVSATLTGTHTPAAALTHLYVMLPVLDGSKHYWVGEDEVEKLLRAGTGWLEQHPEQQLIVQRYLAHRRSLVTTAVDRLRAADDQPEEEPVVEEEAEAPPSPLNVQRHDAVVAELEALGVQRVVDLGCGPGALLRRLLATPSIGEVVGVDVSARELEIAGRRLRLDRMPERQRDRLRLLQGSATYRDDRLLGYDAVVLMEVVEHLDPDRLPSLESAVLGHARPRHVLVTTPNAEYNVRYERLAPGALRHPDHRFEWTRAELEGWCAEVGARHGYTVRTSGIGESDPDLGAPTQLAVLTRTDGEDVR